MANEPLTDSPLQLFKALFEQLRSWAKRVGRTAWIVAAVVTVGPLIPFAIVGESWGMVWFFMSLPLSAVLKDTWEWWGELAYVVFVTAVNFGLMTAIVSWAIHKKPTSGPGSKGEATAPASEPSASKTDAEEPGGLDGRNAQAQENGLRPLWMALAVGLSALVIFASATSVTPTRVFALMLLIASASALSGAVIGFLFALPGISSSINREKSEEGSDLRPGYSNHLIEKSDWLTKILIGVGLVSLKDLVTWIGVQGEAIGRSAELDDLGPIFGGSLITFFLVWGFLFAYLRRTPSRQAHIVPPAGMSAADLIPPKRPLPIDVRVHLSPQERPSAAEVILPLLHNTERWAARLAEELAEAFLAEPANKDNGHIWIYLARALGRQHNDPQVLDQAKEKLADRASKALKKALALDPNLKSSVRELFQDRTTQVGTDLGSFATDSRFAEFL